MDPILFLDISIFGDVQFYIMLMYLVNILLSNNEGLFVLQLNGDVKGKMLVTIEKDYVASDAYDIYSVMWNVLNQKVPMTQQLLTIIR